MHDLICLWIWLGQPVDQQSSMHGDVHGGRLQMRPLFIVLTLRQAPLPRFKLLQGHHLPIMAQALILTTKGGSYVLHVAVATGIHTEVQHNKLDNPHFRHAEAHAAVQECLEPGMHSYEHSHSALRSHWLVHTSLSRCTDDLQYLQLSVFKGIEFSKCNICLQTCVY